MVRAGAGGARLPQPLGAALRRLVVATRPIEDVEVVEQIARRRRRSAGRAAASRPARARGRSCRRCRRDGSRRRLRRRSDRAAAATAPERTCSRRMWLASRKRIARDTSVCTIQLAWIQFPRERLGDHAAAAARSTTSRAVPGSTRSAAWMVSTTSRRGMAVGASAASRRKSFAVSSRPSTLRSSVVERFTSACSRCGSSCDCVVSSAAAKSSASRDGAFELRPEFGESTF